MELGFWNFGGMDPHALRVLEFPTVVEKLCGFTQWCGGRELLASLRACSCLEELGERQAEVSEALIMLEAGAGPALGGLEDVREALLGAAKGAVLHPETLLEVKRLAEAGRRTGRLMHGHRRECPTLWIRAELLRPFPKLEQTLKDSLSQDGRVLDSASPRLARLRLEVRKTEGAVQTSLQNVLRRSDIARLLQEPIVTQRAGRYVVPVKADHKGHFPGLVIDQSASGATVFMEPYSVVELGNKLRSAILAEEKEVAAVLARLSAMVGEAGPELSDMAEILAHLDATMALARYAVESGANLPEIDTGGELRLVNARHPLLGPECVPISVELLENGRTLVITGPNTGGKTVSLKTIGLLTAMALHGMPIPASSGTRLPLLGGIWADIGDEQSIAQSLSTFSAHLTQILRILPKAQAGHLVLLDELGAGTDPTEGSALGIALLEQLHQQGALTVITTHLSQLKVHAAQTEGFQNAAVEFNAESLSPTYRILMGIPGRSNALQIAEGLGLPRDILRRAREHLGQDHAGVEGLLDDLEQERDAARNLQDRLESESQEVSQLRRSYEEKMRRAAEERERLVAEAAAEAETMVAEARHKVTGLLQDFRKRMKTLGQARRDALEDARQLAEELREKALPGPETPESEDEPMEEAFDDAFSSTETPDQELPEDVVDEAARREARRVEAALAEMQTDLEPLRAVKKAATSDCPLEPGTAVYARKYGQDGEVLSQKGQRVEVRLGAIRMTVDRSELEETTPRQQSGQVSVPQSGKANFSPRLDLRGMTVDEGVFELDRHLDAAALAKVDKVEVIHGKGTGALRKGVQKHLKSHPLALDFRVGEIHEGGWGVTVVNVKT